MLVDCMIGLLFGNIAFAQGEPLNIGTLSLSCYFGTHPALAVNAVVIKYVSLSICVTANKMALKQGIFWSKWIENRTCPLRKFLWLIGNHCLKSS